MAVDWLDYRMKIKTADKIKPFILLMRPQHWIKNILLFAALVFSGQLFEIKQTLLVFLGFIMFCMAASSIYIINDISDLNNDRNNNSKCKRPIASGIISVKKALTYDAILMLLTIIGSFALKRSYGLAVLAYITINIIYTIGIKNIPFVELLSVASGYVLRVVSGAILADCPVSIWLIICTACLSLFLVSEKRYGEIKEISLKGTQGRSVMQRYNRRLLKTASNLFAGFSMLAYAIYSLLFSVSVLMVLTLPLAVFGILRYIHISDEGSISQMPEAAIYKDKIMLITVLLWSLSCCIIIYFI
jgi:4-hydroxybenzoate polyprenyltransferase